MAEATADVSPEDLKAIIDYLVAEANPWPTIDTDSKGHRLPLAQSSPLSLAVSAYSMALAGVRWADATVIS